MASPSFVATRGSETAPLNLLVTLFYRGCLRRPLMRTDGEGESAASCLTDRYTSMAETLDNLTFSATAIQRGVIGIWLAAIAEREANTAIRTTRE